MFDLQQFLADLRAFIAFKTIVCDHKEEFKKARAWIRAFFDPEKTDFVEMEYGGLTSLLIKPKGSTRPNILGDGHIEVVPCADHLFELVEDGGHLHGRGVADMKTQCLMMMYVLRQLIAEGRPNDFWILFTEDEEVGSDHGVRRVVNYLCDHGMTPRAVFAPDGGPDFAYVEKEKGIMTFVVTTKGRAAHASRPFLGDNAIDKMMGFYEAMQRRFPNPRNEQDWVVSVSMTMITAGSAPNAIPERCEAAFDLRLTEKENVDDLMAEIEEIGRVFDADIDFRETDVATYYPREAPIAQQYIDILRRVSGKEPEILHSNGASNGRLYVAKNPHVHVLMSNPTVVGAHADEECLVTASLEPYYHLVLETALLRVD